LNGLEAVAQGFIGGNIRNDSLFFETSRKQQMRTSLAKLTRGDFVAGWRAIQEWECVGENAP
jgi:hypothetical protein